MPWGAAINAYLAVLDGVTLVDLVDAPASTMEVLPLVQHPGAAPNLRLAWR